MVPNLNGNFGGIPPEQRLNVFALVIYIPNPLGAFLDELRRELVPHDNPHAHVSVLPPRPLGVSWQTASAEAGALTADWQPFEVELTEVAIFPVTNVVYLEVGRGNDDLRRMHAAMNTTSLSFQEPFSYHPHLTLAQDLSADCVAAACDRAVQRWREYSGKHVFYASHTVFVQNTGDNRWVDLAEFHLGAKPVPRD